MEKAGVLGQPWPTKERIISTSRKTIPPTITTTTTTTAQLTRSLALCRVYPQAEEMEIKFRKEQGIEDFDPSAEAKAKVMSAGDTARAAANADPSNLVSQAAAAAAVSVKSTPETRATLVAELDNLPPDSKQVIEKMGQLKAEGLAPR